MAKGRRLWKTKHLTLRPPCHGGGDADGGHPDWVLLDVQAYIADRQNATTATTKLSNDHQIQVTIFAAPPPLVSYICAWSPTTDPADLFDTEPTVEPSTPTSSSSASTSRSTMSTTSGPSLTLIPNQDPYLHEPNCITLIPRSSHDFYISTLDTDLRSGIGRYNLCLFDSTNNKWSRDPLSLDQLRNPPDKNEVLHITEKVITLKHPHLVAFVDLWRGIIICDILDSKIAASYVPIPKEIINLNRTRGALITRDIAVVRDRLTMARLGIVFDPDINGWDWELSTWSRPVGSCLDDDDEDWREDFMVESCDILVVYLMGNVDITDEKAVLLTLDMANKRLQRVKLLMDRSRGSHPSMSKNYPLMRTIHLTLHPPCHGGDPSDADHPPEWVLLDVRAYVADRRNATTATARLGNGHAIQVTICAAPPLLVSYICAWSPTSDPAELFEMEPTVEAVNADLVLLRIHVLPYEVEDLVYRAKGWRTPLPSLTPLPKQDPYLQERYNIAILPRSHGFYISTLDCYFPNPERSLGRYCIFDSLDCKWSNVPLSLDQLRNPPDKNKVFHLTEKVIILKDPHLVAFADLWRGIIICDILDISTASYVPMPKEIINLRRTRASSITRDIAVVNGRLTVVRFTTVFDPDINGWDWDLSTWSRAVDCLEQEDWREDSLVEASDILIDHNICNVELLPKIQGNLPWLNSTLLFPLSA
uniref:DUF1618 domain-containing protein n=1 Tax=Oryza meridionalis TaxID=40149 RepID=A0A0E0EUV7_9ORYZ